MQDMLEYIRRYPEMIRDSINITKEAKLPSYKFDKILICGMGGSAIGGNFLYDLLRNETNLIVDVSRGYELPAYVDKTTLVFVISYSGNTEETLSQFVEAKKKGLNLISISSDGYLNKWSSYLGIPFVQLPSGFQPRAALPYLFIPMIEYLMETTEMNFSDDIKEAITVLEELRLDENRITQIKSIASLLNGHRVNVYGPDRFEGAVRRLKCQINENSKMPSSWAVFPELNHNELVGYEDNEINNDDYVIILRNDTETKSIDTRIEITKDILRGKVKGISEIYSVGNSSISKMLSLAFIGDMLSYYMAKEQGKSPLKTESITRLKLLLKESLNMQEQLEKEIV